MSQLGKKVLKRLGNVVGRRNSGPVQAEKISHHCALGICAKAEGGSGADARPSLVEPGSAEELQGGTGGMRLKTREEMMLQQEGPSDGEVAAMEDAIAKTFGGMGVEKVRFVTPEGHVNHEIDCRGNNFPDTLGEWNKKNSG